MSNPVVSSVWLTKNDCRIEEFSVLVERSTVAESVPSATRIVSNIPVYHGVEVSEALEKNESRRALLAEWNRVFDTGPGILAVERAYSDLALIDAVTGRLEHIMADEAASGAGGGDHFAPAGENSRLWNAHEKLCMAAPALFARYNANPIIDAVSEAWLGPGYQVTTQVNVVHPGGKAQSCHRDYHMGFQSLDTLEHYPASVHRLSAALTLQGAIAHSDMPLESGPTKLLPYSQIYLPGYLATHLPAFQDYFETHAVQLPLARGDALFFNPAVFHAAGENRTKTMRRFANLMQIGSGYGRSIEILDRLRMSVALYPVLLDLARSGELDTRQIQRAISACAEPYPFPANLDVESPSTGMAPPSQQDLMRQAIRENWSVDAFTRLLKETEAKKRSH